MANHRRRWGCTACGAPLGEIRRNETLVVKDREVALGPSAALVRCPQCPTARIWSYTQPAQELQAIAMTSGF